jgi:hypothetical protein
MATNKAPTTMLPLLGGFTESNAKRNRATCLRRERAPPRLLCRNCVKTPSVRGVGAVLERKADAPSYWFNWKSSKSRRAFRAGVCAPKTGALGLRDRVDHRRIEDSGITISRLADMKMDLAMRCESQELRLERSVSVTESDFESHFLQIFPSLEPGA